jgi:hypothetical protein
LLLKAEASLHATATTRLRLNSSIRPRRILKQSNSPALRVSGVARRFVVSRLAAAHDRRCDIQSQSVALSHPPCAGHGRSDAILPTASCSVMMYDVPVMLCARPGSSAFAAGFEQQERHAGPCPRVAQLTDKAGRLDSLQPDPGGSTDQAVEGPYEVYVCKLSPCLSSKRRRVGTAKQIVVPMIAA